MEFMIYDIAIVPVIVALVALFTSVGLPKRFAPIVALVCGIIAGVVYVAPSDLPQAIFIGIVMGLAASGLYSGTKNTLGK